MYSEVLSIVKRRVEADKLLPSSIEEAKDWNRKKNGTKEEDMSDNEHASAIVLRGEMARLVAPIVSRKVIKQTVMTSVYGVTRVGARLQVYLYMCRHYKGIYFINNFHLIYKGGKTIRGFAI